MKNVMETTSDAENRWREDAGAKIPYNRQQLQKQQKNHKRFTILLPAWLFPCSINCVQCFLHVVRWDFHLNTNRPTDQPPASTNGNNKTFLQIFFGRHRLLNSNLKRAPCTLFFSWRWMAKFAIHVMYSLRPCVCKGVFRLRRASCDGLFRMWNQIPFLCGVCVCVSAS